MSSDFCNYYNYTVDENLCDPTDPDACTPCMKLRELDEQVKQIRAMLVGLEKQRPKLKTQVNQHHDRLILRLPHEIATEIFELCIPESLMAIDTGTYTDTYTETDTDFYPPLTISAVCKGWRNMAYTMPSLWKFLPLWSKRVNLNAFLDPFFVKKWIERAGQFPLSILLRLSYHEIDIGIGIVNVLNQYSTRWLEFRCESPILLFSHLPHNYQDLPNLRTLQLTSTDYLNGPPFKICPQRLNVLALNGIALATLDLGFDWTHLTQLTMSEATLLEIFEVLRRAPNLLKCILGYGSIVSGHHDLEFWPPPNAFVHTKIQELYIITSLYKDIFQKLLCPALKTLTLHFDEFDTQMLLAVAFLQRSECFLERLNIVNAEQLSRLDITSICQVFPTLQHLSVVFDYFDNCIVPDLLYTTIAQFSIIDDNPVPQHLPALRSLSFEVQETKYDVWQIFQSILPLANLQPIRSLESITILVSPKATRADWDVHAWVDVARILKEILRLREAGVNLKLQFGRAKEDWVYLAAIGSGDTIPVG